MKSTAIAFAAFIMASPAVAQFESHWQNRVAEPMIETITPPIEAAQPFDEEQHNEDVVREEHKRHVAKADAEEKPHRRHSSSSCMTLREARDKWPDRYLSWRGHHCWFAPPERSRRSYQRRHRRSE